LAKSNNIVVIAPDLALRQSLTFSLEVEGFKVEAFGDWADDAVLPSSMLCMVIDDEVVRNGEKVRQDLRDVTPSVILLTDGLSPPTPGVPGHWLAKPFEGAELLRMVRSFAPAA
jgi:DNA-binding response OmpR family regulator